MTSSASENQKNAQNGKSCYATARTSRMSWNLFGTPNWRFIAAQHFAYFQRQLRSFGVSHQHYTLHGLRGGGATDHWLQHRHLPLLRRRGWWTSERTLERYIQEVTILLHQNQLSKEFADRLRARASFLCRTRLRRVPPPAPTATTMQRKGSWSSLRSAQWCRATDPCPHRLDQRSVSFTTQ